jgi:hypothetical protein
LPGRIYKIPSKLRIASPSAKILTKINREAKYFNAAFHSILNTAIHLNNTVICRPIAKERVDKHVYVGMDSWNQLATEHVSWDKKRKYVLQR